jgi:opacity protein-like surface antigen
MNYKRITILLLAITTLSGFSYSQLLKSYGVKLGVTSAIYDWRASYPGQVSPNVKKVNGWNFALHAEWFNNSYVTAVTQLEYSQKGTGIAWNNGSSVVGDISTANELLEIDRVNYLSMPILLKIYPLQSYVSPYLILGPRFDFLLNKEIHSGFSVFNSLNKTVFGYSLGFGIESIPMSNIELSVELRYNYDISKSYNVETSGIVIYNKAVDLWLGIGI